MITRPDLALLRAPTEEKDMNSERSKYSYLKNQRGVIRKLTGKSIEKFDDELNLLRPKFIEQEKKRLLNTKRKRAIGGGRKQDLSLDDKLLMILMYNNLFLTHEFLGALFQMHNSNISRTINYFEPLIKDAGIELPERKIRISDSTLSQAQILEIFSNFSGLSGDNNTDTTLERPISSSSFIDDKKVITKIVKL